MYKMHCSTESNMTLTFTYIPGSEKKKNYNAAISKSRMIYTFRETLLWIGNRPK